jgi:hypothetical protein
MVNNNGFLMAASGSLPEHVGMCKDIIAILPVLILRRCLSPSTHAGYSCASGDYWDVERMSAIVHVCYIEQLLWR